MARAFRKEEKEFIPVNLVLESQEEVDVLYAILNNARICDHFRNEKEYDIVWNIRETLDEFKSDVHKLFLEKITRTANILRRK